jgi:hypothetical protein|tara:strand:+ start:2898 stop:3125 length:228 start_codon:yes stop_codon:yes gene_type:complete
MKNRGKILQQAIIMAEDLFPGPKKGKEKRAWVIKFINEHVNFPILNERQEAKIIGFAVDVLCDLMFQKVQEIKQQ